MKIYFVEQYEQFEADDPFTPGKILWVYHALAETACGDTEVFIYMGQAQLGNQLFRFRIPDASGVNEAFAKYDVCGTQEGERIAKEARQKALSAPGVMPKLLEGITPGSKAK
jgi:hypothetical protein